MDINEFISNFADQFEDTDTTGFTAETDFRDNDEWSSLTALSILAMVDEEYDIILKGKDIEDAKTIGDLFRLVEAKA